jgi:hypothetical protein
MNLGFHKRGETSVACARQSAAHERLRYSASFIKLGLRWNLSKNLFIAPGEENGEDMPLVEKNGIS